MPPNAREGLRRSPASPRSIGQSPRAMLAALGLLVVSQVLIFAPGTDVSPYGQTVNPSPPLLILGNTVQVWALVAVMALSLSTLVRFGSQGLRSGQGLALGGLLVCAVSGVLVGASVAELADGVGKVALPLMLALYLSRIGLAGRPLVQFVLVANIFTLGQALFARVLTGSFAANRYYLDLPQEYFGYFYHPFAFSGILSVCSLVVASEIRTRQRRWPLALMLLANFAFISATQVRTYVLAVGIALLVAAVGFTIGKRRPIFSLVVAFGLSTIAVLGASGYLSGTRTTTDTSSGRLDRWIVDLTYVWDSASTAQLMFGGGPGRIDEVNEALFGVRINSLNAFIDLFVDFGLIGMSMIISAWILILVSHYRFTRDALVLSLITMFGISAAVTSPLEFPGVSALMVIALFALRPSLGVEETASTASPTTRS